MALRISKLITDALTAARAGDKGVDLSKFTIPRMGRGGLRFKLEGDAALADNVRSFLLSDKSVDRDRDTIDPAGWNLAEFDVNGAVLFAHNNRALPIAEPLNTRTDGTGEKAALVGDARFPTKEVDEFGALVLRLIDDKILKSVSVGFIPLKWVVNEERHGIDFAEQKLVEWSVVPVGSHPGAMVQLARAKKLDLAPLHDWATKWLDNDESVASAVADDAEVAVMHKALEPWRRTKSGLVVPASVIARAAEIVTPAAEPVTPAAGDAVSTAVEQLATIAASLKGAAMDEARSAKLAKLFAEATELLAIDDDAAVTKEDVRTMVREALVEAFKEPESEADSLLDPIEVRELIREAMAELKADILREAGRLPN